MSASKPSYETKNQIADPNFFRQSISSARASHYSDREKFCNIYFTFLLVQFKLQNSSPKLLSPILIVDKRKQLSREKIDDHITHDK